MRLPDYVVGTWAFTDPGRPLETPLHVLSLGGSPCASAPGSNAVAVYYGIVEPQGRSMLLLHNDLHRSAMSRACQQPDGRWVEEGRWSSGGFGGSYIAFDSGGRHFAVANARSCNWTVFRNGPQPEAIATLTHEGSGPHPRQGCSHPHCIVFAPDDAWLYAADMGADVVLAFPFDGGSGQVGEKVIAYRARPGSGPRHLLIRGGLVYLLNELGNTLVVLRRHPDGRLEEMQALSTLPPGCSEESHTAHLAFSLDGRFLFASNRGHDSIVTFAVAADGSVEPVRWTRSGGKWPWFFLVTRDGNMLVANNLSDCITAFTIEGNGELTPRQNIAVPRPVFIAELGAS